MKDSTRDTVFGIGLIALIGLAALLTLGITAGIVWACVHFVLRFW